MEQISNIIRELDQGLLTVAYKSPDGSWCVNEEAKLAILQYFQNQKVTKNYHEASYDKIPLKFLSWSEVDFSQAKIRVVPGAIVRYGAYIGVNTVLMPSFINIGSHIGNGTMIDSWATIGSCAFIGQRCHISSSAVIGGVLEPISARPVIIEDEVFIGANSSITEGTIVSEGAVIAGGVNLTSSTKIYDRDTDTFYNGFIPPYSVVVPGTIEVSNISKKSNYKHAIYAAIIVKTVDATTRIKTSINEILRSI